MRVDGTPTRPNKYIPREHVPSEKGGQPSTSWDPENGHWDRADGKGNTGRYLNDGTLVDHDNNPIPTRNENTASFWGKIGNAFGRLFSTPQPMVDGFTPGFIVPPIINVAPGVVLPGFTPGVTPGFVAFPGEPLLVF